MEEYGPDIITVVDEDGKEVQFEVLDNIDASDASYIALAPYYDDPAKRLDAGSETLLLRVSEENGEFMLDPIEDESEYAAVEALFYERFNAMFEDDARG